MHRKQLLLFCLLPSYCSHLANVQNELENLIATEYDIVDAHIKHIRMALQKDNRDPCSTWQDVY